MTETRALIFDCDGVLSDTERDGHLVAFNQTFEHFGILTHWSDAHYKEVLSIGGGKERLATLFQGPTRELLGLPSDPDEQAAMIAEWHRYKTERYTDLVRDGVLPARPGVRRIAEEAHEAGWRLGVASTSAKVSVRRVLEHAMGDLAARFEVYAGDIVSAKKPAPDIYNAALEGLAVKPHAAVAVEDSSNGLRAALAAGIPTVVTVSSYTADEDFAGSALVVDCLGDPPEHRCAVIADPLHLAPRDAVRLTDIANLPSPSPHDRA